MPVDAEDFIASFDRQERALVVINNWRSSHNFPLNTFQNGLRQRAKQVDSKGLVAQRIKRLASIKAKLERFPTIRLSQMQDIGGCRAVVSSVSNVIRLVDAYKASELKHKQVRFDDYIKNPKRSGYRGVHLIYRYYSDRKKTYNSLQVEIQLRSTLQHAWATAVETVGTFTRQALKSSQGETEWLRFFALMGTAIAAREDCNPVPDTPTTKDELKSELVDYVRKLDVEGHLTAYGQALSVLEKATANEHYYLLELDPVAKVTKVTGYAANQYERAASDYLETEKNIQKGQNADAVLVSVDSLSSLRRAYPNYFLDTHLFIDAVRQAVK